MERLLDMLQGIIFNGFPKNELGVPQLYDDAIETFFYGDRTVINTTPSVVLEPGDITAEKIAFGMIEKTYNVTISYWVRYEDIEISKRYAMEMARQIYEMLLPHYLMWAVEKCFLCDKTIYTPIHYTSSHSAILSSYVTAAQDAFTTLWESFHLSSQPVPTMVGSGVASEAVWRLWEEIRLNGTAAGLTPKQLNTILSMQSRSVVPIRLFYDTTLSQVQPATNNQEKQLLQGGEFKLTSKEIVRQTSFGPDNVTTTAYL